MRFKLILILLLLSLTACTFDVDVQETTATALPAEGVITEVPASTATIEMTADVSATATETAPLASATAEISATEPVLTVVPNDGVQVIKFPSNGTYVDVADSISAAESHTYSVQASGGQVMAVSVQQSAAGDWTDIQLEIRGQDGTVLCPVQSDQSCHFWRGKLPSTQTYLIELTPAAAAKDLVLRVAISPPGAQQQTFTYQSTQQDFSLEYSDRFAPSRNPDVELSKITPELALQYVDTLGYEKTTLQEAYILFGSSSDAGIVDTCTEPASLAAPENITGEVDLNGVTFTRSDATGVGAGNVYEQVYYRAAVNGTCYEIMTFVHSTNAGAYDPSMGVTEFDQNALEQRFQEILTTFTVK